MHVAIVCDYGHVNGGAAKVAIASARALAERGHHVSFVCAVAPIDRALQHPGIRVHHLCFRDAWTEPNRLRAAKHGVWNGAAWRRLATLLADFDRRDTIVHLHQWTKALSPSVIDSVARARLRHVFTLHDYFLFCPNGLYFDHAQRRPCTRLPLSAGCVVAACDAMSRAHKAVRVLRQFASNAACRRLAPPLNLIHVSRSACAVSRPFFPADTRHFVVHNPSTMPELGRVPVRANDLFVYVGRFTPEKNPVAFATAAHQAGVRAILLGDGPERGNIRRANPEADIHDWSDDRAVAALLARARTLVFPSLWSETSGLAVLEALSKGVPVICSRGTGAADWIEDGVNGFLIPPGDTAALKEYLARLAADDDLAACMGQQAYARYWRNEPGPAQHAERLEACYATILG
jgi:glycosyltransferase involved in cell wall biosynthesis